MNKILSICAVSGLFLLGNGCDGFKVPCTDLYAADSPQCNRSEYLTVVSKTTFSLQGDTVTVSVPSNTPVPEVNYETSSDLFVGIYQYHPVEIGFSTKKDPSILTGRRPTEIDLKLTADQMKGFSAGSAVIQIYSDRKWTTVGITLQ